MENQQQEISQIIKREKSSKALGVFLIQIVLMILFFGIFMSQSFGNGMKGDSSPRLLSAWLIPATLILLSIIYSISLFNKSKKGGKIYGIVDFIITLIIPIIVLMFIIYSFIQ